MIASTPGAVAATWAHRHLLDVDVLSIADLDLVMRTADRMAAIAGARGRDEGASDGGAGGGRDGQALRGLNVTILFYEASTRTRVSFEVAARRLGAEVVNVSATGSSVEKGESLIDTVRTLEATGAHVLVIRHSVSGAPYLAARHFGGHVVNGGDGRHAHPTQALLDLYTVRQRLDGGALATRSIDGLLAGRKVAIVGDVLHSRVARSNLWTLTAAGAEVWVAGPSTLVRGFEAWAASGVAGRPFHVTTDAGAAIRDASVVMTLRLQKERMAAGLLPSLGEYTAGYGITPERLAAAASEALVMHPGPMNEGVEIAPEVASGPRSVITAQVANGVPIRMAVLSLLVAAGTTR